MEQYDLVVVGSSWAGIYAAKTAVQLQARVALVTQSDRPYLNNNTLLTHSFQEIARIQKPSTENLLLSEAKSESSLADMFDWVKGLNTTAWELNSLSSLAALGVDIIVGKGEFYRLPRLGLQVNQRNLRSRHFLLATGSVVSPHGLDNHSGEDYLTLETLASLNLGDLPREIIIVGSDPASFELTQALARLGKQITLVVKHSKILPQEDPDISMLLQAQLEAEGVTILTNSTISQVKVIAGQKWLQAGDRALATAEIIIADYRQPNIQGLNLAGVDVKYNRQRIDVNQKLQTTNPQIYACGDAIGGYNLPNIAQYEVNLILKNTLFLPWYKTNYQTIPWAILTQPNLARVGLTEQQARQQNLSNIYEIKEYFSDLPQAQITNQITGVCKLLVDPQGRILGCSIFGERAAELITIPALMMQHNLKLDSNPMRGFTSITIPTIYPTMVEILARASQKFYYQKIHQNPQLINRLRTWFTFINPR